MVSRNRDGVVKSAIRSRSASASWASRNSARSVPKLAPKRALAAVGERPQPVLVPAEQRRDEQAREAEVIVGLDRELDGGEQVLDRERLVQMQPVDAGDGHSRREQPRHDERGELAAAAHQHEDVAGGERPPCRGQHRRLGDHLPNALGEMLGVAPVAQADPALLALLRLVVEILDRERRPQLDFAGAVAMMGAVRRRRLGQRQRLVAERRDHRIDDIEHRLRRAEARRDRQVAELARAPLVAEQIVAVAERGRALPEPRRASSKRFGSVPWKP